MSRLAHEGTQSVVLGGGEPFLWTHDIYRLAGLARQLGLLAQVGTNATMVAADDGSRCTLSTAGSFLWNRGIRSAIHDRLRAFDSGHLHKVIHLLERLRREAVEVTVSSLVTKENAWSLLIEVGDFLA